MYCKRCNEYFSKKAKFCDACGDSLMEKESNDSQINTLSKKNKKRTVLIITIIIFVVVSVGFIIFSVLSITRFINKMSTKQYIELGDNKIPTIYMYDNNIKIDSYNKNIYKGEIEVEITYYDDLYSTDILERYLTSLKEDGFTYIKNEYEEVILSKKSIDGYGQLIIEIEMGKDYYNSKTDITYTYTQRGYIPNYPKENFKKRVGKEQYGYIDIDSTWELINTDDEIIRYEGVTGWITLSYMNVEPQEFIISEYLSTIHNSFNRHEAEAENIQLVEEKEIIIEEYNGYQIIYRDHNFGINIIVWYFIDENNIAHCITLNSMAEIDASIIESYSLKK